MATIASLALNIGESPSLLASPADAVDPILLFREVCALTRLHRVTITRRTRDGTFPPPTRLGKKRLGWRRSTIEGWIAANTVDPVAQQPFPDRAAVVAVVIEQIVRSTSDPAEQRRRIEEYLRDEFADVERLVAADRSHEAR